MASDLSVEWCCDGRSKERGSRSRLVEWTQGLLARVVCVCTLPSADGPYCSPHSLASPLRYSHLLLLAGNLDGRSRLLDGRCHRRKPPARKPYRMAVLRDRAHFRAIPLQRRIRCLRLACTVPIASGG